MDSVKIVDNIYHVGDKTTLNGLDCNPYLLIEQGEAVLIDPGSVLDFESVLANIQKLIDIQQIKYIVLHHEDPDFCGSVPLFEKLGIHAKIVTSWRTMTLAQYYGIQSEYYLIEENDNKLTMASGRVLQFISTPYLHFAGSFTSYDVQTKSLFSSDLFGAFSYNRTFYADETYLDKMLTFHEHYMPANSVLRPIMDTLMKYDIQTILPQHGSVIRDQIPKYIEALRTLECGTLLSPIRKSLMASGGYVMVYNDVCKRLLAIYSFEQVVEVFSSIPELTLNGQGLIVSYSGSPKEVWDKIFETIKERKGMIWITIIEPFVRSLVTTYEIPMPKIFSTMIETVELENQRLIAINQSLEQTIKSVNDKLFKCEITGLYNEFFLKSLIINELENNDWRDIGAIACVSIDNFSKYKLNYGLDEEKNILNNMAYLLKQQFGSNATFRLATMDFGLYIKGYSPDKVIEKMEQLRVLISKSELFLGDMTVSIGIAFSNELELDLASYDTTMLHYIEVGFNRVRKAKIQGKNRVCYEGDKEIVQIANQSVLIVDSDETNLYLISTYIKDLGLAVFTAKDGAEALKIAEAEVPKVIISEINLPKVDGFLVREELLAHSRTQNIEMIYLSYQKDQELVQRAQSLGITYYLKKPYILSELVGLIRQIIGGDLE